MTVLGTDTFTRSNQTGWGTASDGQTWSHPHGTATLSIASNEGKLTAVTGLNAMLLGTKTTADAEAIVRCSLSATADGIGLVLRSDGANNYYSLRQKSGSVTINKVVAGTNTALATTSNVITVSTFYWMRFRIVGSALMGKIWADGTAEPAGWTVTLASDTTFTSGQIGIFGQVNSTTDTVQFDSFWCVDYINCDVIPITSSLSGTDTVIPTESIPISETAFYTDSAILEDDIPLTDSAVWTQNPIGPTTTTYSFPEQLSITSSLSATLTTVPLESVPISDTFVPSNGLVAVDSIPISDVASVALSYIPVENNSVGSSVLSQDAFTAPAESIPIRSSLAASKSFVPLEAIPIGESAAYVRSGNFSSAIPLNESVMYSSESSVTESNSITSLLSSLHAFSALDADPITSVLGGGAVYNPNDPLSVISTVLGNDGVSWVDVFPISDSAVWTQSNAGATNTTYSFLELLSIVSSLSCVITSTLVENNTISSKLSQQEGANFPDNAPLTSSLTCGQAMNAKVGLTITSALSIQNGGLFLDNNPIISTLNGQVGSFFLDLGPIQSTVLGQGGPIFVDLIPISSQATFALSLGTTEALAATSSILGQGNVSFVDLLSILSSATWTQQTGPTTTTYSFLEALSVISSIIGTSQVASIDVLPIKDMLYYQASNPAGDIYSRSTLVCRDGRSTLMSRDGRVTLVCRDGRVVLIGRDGRVVLIGRDGRSTLKAR